MHETVPWESEPRGACAPLTAQALPWLAAFACVVSMTARHVRRVAEPQRRVLRAANPAGQLFPAAR